MSVDRFRLIETFVCIARRGSFSAAAEELGMSRAAVSKHMMDLEAFLGSRLLNRSTRKVSLTEIGETYYESCTKILTDFEAANASAQTLQSGPHGTLRILAPRAFVGGHLAEAIAQFARTYPTIHIVVSVYDSGVKALSLNDGDFDVAIRLWPLEDGSPYVAKQLGSLQWVVCAAPTYLEQYGRPETPNALTRHNCLISPRLAPDRIWRFADPIQPVKVTGTFVAHSIPAVRQAAVTGVGIAMLPLYFVGGDIRDGKLEVILEDFAVPERPVWLLYPPSRLMSKVRLFQSFMADWTRKRSWNSMSFSDAR